jgi:protocatechuate 3,4-dioxygenase beta subunit
MAMEKRSRQAVQPLTRRRALTLLGGSALWLAAPRAAAAAAASPSARETCVVRPRQTEGPFFVDADLNRSDIRAEPKTGAVSGGAPVRVTFRVSRMSGGRCEPLPRARVDLWHCDAAGLYSDVARGQPSTRGLRFLRGYQVTGADGLATFTTIFPGWYPGRTVHMHFKVSSEAHEFVSQLYFDDELTDRIHAHPPYATRSPRAVRNGRDFIFRSGGERLMLPLREEKQVYVGVFDIALDM